MRSLEAGDVEACSEWCADTAAEEMPRWWSPENAEVAAEALRDEEVAQ